MASIKFLYEGRDGSIQCQMEDKIDDIFQKFLSKINMHDDINSVFFLYNGEIIEKKDSTIEEITKDKNVKEIAVKVCINKEEEQNISLIKSKEIICPKCGENCKIKIENYKISLFGCKNKHKINNIFLKEYENTQNIDESKIECEVCKKNENNKSNVFNRQFYVCNFCKMKFCPLCKSKHYKDHHIY